MKASIIFLAFLFTIVATVSTSAQPGDKPITYASAKDADPQANATSGVGIEPKNVKSGLYECIIDNKHL